MKHQYKAQNNRASNRRARLHIEGSNNFQAKMKKKNLRICFGVHDFLCFQNNNWKFLLPFFVPFSCSAVRLIDDPNQTNGRHSVKIIYAAPKIRESNQNRQDPEPENLLNNRTSHGLVSFAVPSSSNAFIRSRARPWHLQQRQLSLSTTLW